MNGHARNSRTGLPPIAAALITAVVVVAGLGAMVSPSPIAVGLSGLTLIFIIALLWRASEPPILLLPVLFQWSEVAIQPLSTIWKQIPLNEMTRFGVNLEFTAAYGFAGITALAIGLRLGSCGGMSPSLAARLQSEAGHWRFDKVVRIGMGLIVVAYILDALSSFTGPARELFRSFSGIKYIGIFLIAYWILVNKRNYWFLAGIVAFEVIFGMTGFFAEFKNSILTLLVAVMAARTKLRVSDLAAAAVVAVLILSTATFWTAVKGGYRLMVNQGTGQQVVAVPLGERLEFIAIAFANLDARKVSDGFDMLVSRHGYIEYLALVIQNVPAAVPHEDGQLTLNVISHITMPRILFPNKPPLPSDTQVMQKYTGLSGQWDANTSISIGNLAELYIDFGFIGGLVGELMIGLMVAHVYRRLGNSPRRSAILTAGLCVMVVLPIAYFGTAYVKMIGAFVFTSIIALALQRYVAPQFGHDTLPIQHKPTNRSVRHAKAPGSSWL